MRRDLTGPYPSHVLQHTQDLTTHASNPSAMNFPDTPSLPTRLARLGGLVLLLLLAAPLAFAQVLPTLADTFEAPEPDITELDFGDVIEPLGDVDGDGTADVAVGGPNATIDEVPAVGRAYVVSGADGTVIHTLASPTLDLLGNFANTISNLGDLDGDGTADFVVTHQSRVFDGDDTGAAYVYSGATGAVLYTLESPTPEDGGDFGSASASAGDVDGDGLQDILIGALNENEAANGNGAGQVHVFSGADGAFIRTLTRPFTPAGGIFSFFGREVYLVGDLDGDGLRDHAVFTRYEGQGRVDFFSAADGAPIDFIAETFTSGAGEFGQALITVPDLSGDGVDEILIGAPSAENISPLPPREGRGVVGLYDGATRDLLRQFRPGAEEGSEPGGTGFALALGTDLDGDGTRDFYAGSPGADAPIGFPGQNAGRVYIFSTGAGTKLGQFDSPNITRIGVFGDALATADLDGDGKDELLVGAPRENELDGRAYVYAQVAGAAVVQDGSFEATDPETGENPFWTQFGVPSNPICSVETCGPNEGIEAFDGNWFLFFGRSLDGTMGFAEQEVTIPDSVNTLSFYLKIVPGSGGFVRALIDGEILFEATPANADTYAEYQRVDVDITEYADGESHTLRFQSATPSANPPNPTFFFIDQVSITNQASTALIELTPNPVNFMEVQIGTVAEIEVTLSNPGGDPLEVSDVTITPATQNQYPEPPITTDLMPPFTVEAGESTTFTVSFAPELTLTAVVELAFTSNASTSPDVILAGGTGVDNSASDFSVDPASLSFEVQEGQVAASQTVTLTNNGDGTGIYAVTTVLEPGARVARPSADRLRPGADFVQGEPASTYRRGGGGDLVTDGSFEATPDDGTRDNPFWDEFSAQIGSPFCNTACFDVAIARTGDWAAIFGFDVETGTDFIEQDIELEAQSYDLTFFYTGGTDRDSDGVEEAEAFFRVYIDDEVIYELSADEAQDFTLDYQPLTLSFDVETAGTKTLRFELEQITADDDVMQIIFDDVSLAPSMLVLDVDPMNGTVEAGGEQELTVTADATQAEPGTYTAELLITTNDPDTPTLTVDVTVTVLPTVANEDDAVPTVFALRQNYPNPFAGRTTIEYDLAVPEAVRIEVYDVTGRRVATLVDETQSAGRYEVAWEADALPSGVYVYRIEAGSFRDMQKTVLVR